MMNQLVIFKNHKVKIISDYYGNIYFHAQDIGTILEIEDVKSTIRNYGKKHKILMTNSEVQNMHFRNFAEPLNNRGEIFLTEAGVYKLAFRSPKKEAEDFTDWITSEVLPSIRKYGFYATDRFLENLDYAIKVFQELKEERLKNKRLEEHFHKTESFASFGRAIASSRDGILIGNYAKILKNTNVKIGQNRLFRWLRSNGYLIKNGARKNTPTQKSIDLDLLVLEEMTILTSNGSTVKLKTLITGKGQKYFYGLLKKDFGIKDKLLFDSFDLSVLRLIKDRAVKSGLTPDMMDDSTEFLELVFSYARLIPEMKAVKKFWYDI